MCLGLDEWLVKLGVIYIYNLFNNERMFYILGILIEFVWIIVE